ncbi:MAG: hypothetical protein ABI205_10365, partial [Gemmatimonadaceae bacterium]
TFPVGAGVVAVPERQGRTGSGEPNQVGAKALSDKRLHSALIVAKDSSAVYLHKDILTRIFGMYSGGIFRVKNGE